MECKPKACDEDSPTSSMDSCSGEQTAAPAPAQSTASSGCRPATRRRGVISTDLHLSLTLSSVHTDSDPSTPRSNLTTAATGDQEGRRSGGHGRRRRSLFVKVYMEGIPIGRKLDLLLLDGYSALVAQLTAMFRASITYPDAMMGYHQQFAVVRKTKEKVHHVVTYQDQEGDWMMAGDVPWELFLASVKRLRIARADNKYCYVQ